MMGLGMTWMGLILFEAVCAGVWLIQVMFLGTPDQTGKLKGRPSPQEIVRQRYAAGEISYDEYRTLLDEVRQ